jgi:hypothetical protein
MSLAAVTVEPAQLISDAWVVVKLALSLDWVQSGIAPDKDVVVVWGLTDAEALSFP